jgi:predicted regulator of Ras-like GTPase activity (Roadblock/LC7/MglB family)
MNIQEGFPVSVLTDIHGLTVAWAASDKVDSERQSAAVALVRRTAANASEQLGMSFADEISVFDSNGQKLICRPFMIDEDPLILAVMVTGRDTSYRRATNHVIHEIRQIWKTYWK